MSASSLNVRAYDQHFPPLPKRRTRSSRVQSQSDVETSDIEMSPPTTDNEEEQPEQQPEEVHVEEKYSGSDITIAKQFCTKDSEGYEYLFYKSKKDKDRKVKITIYRCAAANCPCEMQMETPIIAKRSKRSKKSKKSQNQRTQTFVVKMLNEHKQAGEVVEHCPVPSQNFRWGLGPMEFMAEYVRNHSVSSPSVVLQELKHEEIDNGATLKQVFFI